MPFRSFVFCTLACAAPAAASALPLVELDAGFESDGVFVVPPNTAGTARTVAHLPRRDKGSVAVVAFTGGQCPALRECVLTLGFSDGGRVDTIGGPGPEIAFTSVGGAAIDSQDRVLIAGANETAPGNVDFQVLRLLANGAADAGFGNGGAATVGFDYGGNDTDIAHAVAIDAGDRVVLAGAVELAGTLDTDFGIARLRTNGTLDPSFNLGGRVTIHFDLQSTNPTDAARAVAVQADGNIVVAGTVRDFAVNVMRIGIARMTPDGGLDPTWCEEDCDFTYGTARNGKRVIFFGAASEAREHDLAHLAVGDGGEVVIAGNMRFGGVFSGFVQRFAYDGDFQRERTINAGDASPGSATRLGSVSLVDPGWPASDMIVTGTTGPAGDNRFFAQRLDFQLAPKMGWANGAPDTSLLQWIASDSLFDPGEDRPGLGSIDARGRVLTAGAAEVAASTGSFGAMMGRIQSPTFVFADGLETEGGL
ncbi:hypothetical protein [Chiayiivirga flava]|uniref:Putative delta-60 repeat protein n=1 Tax=Chiayiivirga flava TaxID=659595 RepID=A0A7W8D539_9GAMM|nr:hypothetical protein [Chiayiivirga flava]MBB5208084.1 putative delta-60 repeat protein [Chiayiivirga flava]